MQPDEAYVLVIEDDAHNALITAELLRMIGVKYIDTGSSRWQGLDLAENMARVDLILLDIQLPHEDGYTILKQIRISPKLKETCVVAVAAYVLPEDEAQARTAGFDGFIGKPLDFDRFPQQILGPLAGQPVWTPH